VEGRDGPLGTVAGTREGGDGTDLAYLLVRQPRLWGLWHRTKAVPLSWMREGQPGFRGVTLDASRAEVAGSPLVRPDREVRVDVASALWPLADTTLKGKLHLTVHNGIVELSGNTQRQSDTMAAVGAAQTVPGVLGVRNRVIDDDGLTVAVTSALSALPSSADTQITVRVRLGSVAITGHVPDCAGHQTATTLVSAVPGVRHVRNDALVASQMAGPAAFAPWSDEPGVDKE
jgi:osmotically-inducible protein OsmY